MADAFEPSIRLYKIPKEQNEVLSRMYPSLVPEREKVILDIEKINFPNNALDFQENLQIESSWLNVSTVLRKLLGLGVTKRGNIVISSISDEQGLKQIEIEETEFFTEVYKFIIPRQSFLIRISDIGRDSNNKIDTLVIMLKIEISIEEGIVPNLNERGETIYGLDVKGANFRYYRAFWDVVEKRNLQFSSYENFDKPTYPKFVNYLYAYIYDFDLSNPIVLFEYEQLKNIENRDIDNVSHDFNSLNLLSRLMNYINYNGNIGIAFNMKMRQDSVVFEQGVNFVTTGRLNRPIYVVTPPVQGQTQPAQFIITFPPISTSPNDGIKFE